MESIIQQLDDGKFFAYVSTVHKIDGAWCSHVYEEYKPRFFKTNTGAKRSTEKFIELNSQLLNIFLQKRKEIEALK